MNAVLQDNVKIGDRVFVFDGALLVTGTVQDIGALTDEDEKPDDTVQIGEELYTVEFDPIFKFRSAMRRFHKKCIYPTYDEANRAFRETFEANPKQQSELIKYFRKVTKWPLEQFN